MKKFRLILTALFFSYIFVSCGKDGSDGSDAQNQEDKSIFSIWTRDDGLRLDFEGARFNIPFVTTAIFPDGAKCSCRGVISGAESLGAIKASSCSYIGGGAGDPGCVFYENNGVPYTYTKENSTLLFCSAPNDCGTYF